MLYLYVFSEEYLVFNEMYMYISMDIKNLLMETN